MNKWIYSYDLNNINREYHRISNIMVFNKYPLVVAIKHNCLDIVRLLLSVQDINVNVVHRINLNNFNSMHV